MNGMLLTFMALGWLIGFLHGCFGRGYSLKHKMYYDRADDAIETATRSAEGTRAPRDAPPCST